ncbi:zinc-binding dehydrogenase [Bradyrhizobium sp. 160]|uniref:zinc-binding dehydrogenase n=1 Tax=Bradyrhizobium sp. 160 TaxID=2782634 RepID=UPI001FFA995F|nr:zinc-binding dehydrogenase [Bradyrhizobium sp. 160]
MTARAAAPGAAFARARGMNFFMVFLFGLLSRKIIRGAGKRGVEYSFLFVHPDGGQLSRISDILTAGHIRPVIDKVFPFAQPKDALGYLAKGRAKGKVVVQLR